jgi:hypothetical protein
MVGAPDGRAVSGSTLAERWRKEAAILQARGAGIQAEVLLGCAAELDAEGSRWLAEPLTLQQAVVESGYSYSTLQKLVADGALPNAGTPHRPRVQRGLLPRKAGEAPPLPQGPRPPDLATRVLQGAVRWHPVARRRRV